MTALALPFQERPQHGLGRSFALAALVHIGLGAVLFLGVRWQIHAPEVVSVDLVAPLPPAAVEAPKPAPKVEPPPPPKVEPKVEPKPEPKVAKPDIALKEKPKPKPEPKKVEVKPKADPSFQKQLREQMAMEQKALDQQRQERELKDLLARQQADAARAAASARNKALAGWQDKIRAKIRSNIPATAIEGIPGNAAAVFDVVQIPSGDIITVKMRKSSGFPRYDEAVERAILKSSPLPPPPSGELFQRALELTFRPQDQ